MVIRRPPAWLLLLLLASSCLLGNGRSAAAPTTFLTRTLAALGHSQATHVRRHGQPFLLTQSSPSTQRCISTSGTWCVEYHGQKDIPWKPAPRGNKQCNNNCNGVGNCNHDTGRCECPAGWSGDDCHIVQKRPCTNGTRGSDDRSGAPLSHIDENGRDTNWEEMGPFVISRCGGICDSDLAMCWCDGPKGHIPAPKGSPPGTPPIQLGRPMVTPMCQPKETKDGKRVAWGQVAYKDLYGPKGWCVADDPEWKCAACNYDGLGGPTCEQAKEMFCVNQCNGHGTCNLGFCKCDPGWYGHDCSRKAAGQPLEPSRIPQVYWLNTTVQEAVAGLVPVPKPTRKRPLIYVYDLEPLYNSKLLQYRITSGWCVHRTYRADNSTEHNDFAGYFLETLLHERLIQSEHRTFDPSEADFFYVPVYVSCLIYPVLGWADYPWFSDPGFGSRVAHASGLVLETKRWIEEHFPFWNKRGGRDHIWLFTHDEGACWAPTEVASSIWLTYWGRLGLNHSSNTANGGDSYNVDHKSSWMPGGWLPSIQGHPCYEPKKDLVIPVFKSPKFYENSPLLGKDAKPRDILLLFKGDVGKARLPHYSRGVRQKLYKLASQNGWKEKHNILIGDRTDVVGDYSRLLARAKFCLVPPGDGYSTRVEDAVLHGCVPLIIMDDVHVAYETVLDWASFSIRIKEKDLDKTLETLKAVSSTKLKALQLRLSRVWHRFRFLGGPALINEAQHHEANNQVWNVIERSQSKDAANGTLGGMARELPRPFRGDATVDDAFNTILQWLHSRIPFSR